MGTPSPSPRRRPRPLWDRTTVGLAALIVLVGAGGAVAASAVPSRRDPAPVVEAAHLEAASLPRPRPAGSPVAVRIPAIGVDAELVSLGLDAGGGLEVPPYEKAGWFGGGPRPGEAGAAVIAAHVDSRTGPAVFFRLRALQAGDTISVEYDDGKTEAFVVTGTDTYAKSAFPTARIYGSTPGPELRLITCSGRFDRGAGSYVDNLVVWATGSGVEPADGDIA